MSGILPYRFSSPLLPTLIFLVFSPVMLFSQEIDSLATEAVKDAALELHGGVGASLIGYSADGIDRRREPLSWTINGTLDASVYGIDIPIDFILSEQERSFRQPFNRIGLSPEFKSIRTHFGYRSMQMSEYSLNGVSFLGGGVELSPGPLRVMGMYGRFQRAVEEDTAELYVLPAYERWGYAGKLGIETETVEFGVTYLHAWDDSTSLQRPPQKVDVRPQENSVAALTVGISIVPDHLRFESEGAASIMSRDVRSPQSDTTDIPSELQSIQTIRNSTTLTLATRMGLEFTAEDLSARLAYERIEPDFESLGAYYFTTDVERFLLEPTMALFDRKLYLSGSIGLEHDNLLDTRLAETSRVIGSAVVGWDPTPLFGIDASYLNYSTGQGAGREPLNDTIALRSVSQSASLGPRFLFTGDRYNHFVALIGSLQDYTDRNAFTSQLSDSRSITGNLIYSISFVKTPLSAGLSLLRNTITTADLTTSSTGGAINGTLGLFDSRLSLTASLGYTATRQEFAGTDAGADVLNQTLNATWTLGRSDRLNFSLFATESSGDLTTTSDYSELTGILNYTHTFSLTTGPGASPDSSTDPPP